MNEFYLFVCLLFDVYSRYIFHTQSTQQDPNSAEATCIIKMNMSNITSQLPVWINNFQPHQINYMDPSLEAYTKNSQDPPARDDVRVPPIAAASAQPVENGNHVVATASGERKTDTDKPPASKRPRRTCVITPTKVPLPVTPSKLPVYSPAKADVIASPNKVLPTLQIEIDVAAAAILEHTGRQGNDLYKCAVPTCLKSLADGKLFTEHMFNHSEFKCIHCSRAFEHPVALKTHMKEHSVHRFFCCYCDETTATHQDMKQHFCAAHKRSKTTIYALNDTKRNPEVDVFVVYPGGTKEEKNFGLKLIKRMQEMRSDKKSYLPDEVDLMPQANIYSDNIFCALCQYKTKVRLNMLRHLANCREDGTAAAAAANDPVNPVPCLDTGEMHFDRMINLAASSNITMATIDTVCRFVPEDRRYVCGTSACRHKTVSEDLLRSHISTLHSDEQTFTCGHCKKVLCETNVGTNVDEIIYHMRMHDAKVFKCPKCNFCNLLRGPVDRHIIDEHPRCKDKPVFMNHSNSATDTANARGPNDRPTVYRWKCTICKILVATKAMMQQHIVDAHRITSKYLCNGCGFNSDNKSGFGEHFDAKHRGQNVGFKNYYDRVEVADDSDVTPLWRRDDPNRVG